MLSLFLITSDMSRLQEAAWVDLQNETDLKLRNESSDSFSVEIRPYPHRNLDISSVP